MNTYQIDPDRAGWFRVTVIAPNGKSHIRTGFVSEFAARKWVERCRKTEMRKEAAVSAKGHPVSH
jgi:hypothetical protein